ncbi:MAG: hypothetical protein ACT4N8_01895 [Sphingosinicella sp.]
MMPTPHPANVPGDFYVEDSCCLACGVWETEAPGLLAWLEDGEYPHCYVARQPETDAEFRQMLRAMEVQDLNCLRVRDCKPEWAQELCRNRLGAQIDNEQTRMEAERETRPRGFLAILRSLWPR